MTKVIGDPRGRVVAKVDETWTGTEKVFLFHATNQTSAFTSLTWQQAEDVHRALGEILAKKALCKTASTESPLTTSAQGS